jgi:hypothetical protein
MTAGEYFAQDIIVRLGEAVQALLDAGCDPTMFSDDRVGISVTDVMNDAIVAIERLRGASEPRSEMSAELRKAWSEGDWEDKGAPAFIPTATAI